MTITDTLGRVINFHYDGNGNLDRIWQRWTVGTEQVDHDWATFSYGSVLVEPNFGEGLLVNGPASNLVTVLTQVNLDDGSYYTFEYNNAFGQVKRLNHYAPDGLLLAYTSYNVASTAGQTECPRFTERRDYAVSWNYGAEAVTLYSAAGDNSWSKVTAPDGTIYKESYATTGWQTGLTTATKNYANATDEGSDTGKKWTTATWTQDDVNLTYQKNPRPTETKVYDSASNLRKTVIGYVTVPLPNGVSCNLPNDVKEYAADGTNVLRRTHTEYLSSSAYLDRRIIGLPEWKYLYDSDGNLAAKSYLKYDWDLHLDDLPGAFQHDDTNYSKATMITGRGNLSMVRRYNVTDPDNTAGEAVDFKWSHNTTGQVTLTRDMDWHQTFISYTDSFSDGVSRPATFAYPTSVTDADGYQSLAKYNFDFGAVTWRQTPSPNSGQTAPTVSYTYDSAARPEQVTSGVNGAYTRWEYTANHVSVKTFSTIVSGAGEAFSVQLLDGIGRPWFSASDHPGSSGGYSAQMTLYDAMGRPYQQSNPTEVTSAWAPTGTDAAGYVWHYQQYDWKGRPTLSSNSDGSTSENSYAGCGCAGGEQVTARDEAGRRRRLTMDVLGRLIKVEELKLDQTVYTTTNYAYNVRDQIASIDNAGQPRWFHYDGHGRLVAQYTVEQNWRQYTYNPDDTVDTMMDGRSATTTFSYNGRHLLTGVAYQLPGYWVTTPNVSYEYDDAGNRKLMTDGLGSVTYTYDQLSRLKSENREFNGITNASSADGKFKLTYDYNLAGELKSITNPWGSEVGYGYDQAGRVTGMTGAGLSSASTYISNIKYRAFGATQQVDYGNGKTLSLSYNNRMFMSDWNIPGVLGYTYHYDNYGENNTGRVTFADNVTNGAARDGSLDRSWYYDDAARLAVAYTGSEARATIGTDTWGHPDGPYAQIYLYDVWGNRTHREGWGGIYGTYTNDYPTFSNNRENGLTYDGAGNYTAGGTLTYDATGQQIASSPTLTNAYDGDRMRGKRVDNGTATYYLRSSVLGGHVVAEINASGSWSRGYVYLGGQMLAIQANSAVTWVHQEPTTKGQRFTDSAGSLTTTIVEVDPWGGETSCSANSAFQPHRFTSYERDPDGSDEAMNRRYAATASRFTQPDPSDGSYDFTNPQSFNRYAYVNNDPVNFVDPRGLNAVSPGTSFGGGTLWTIWYGNGHDGFSLVHQWFEPYPSGTIGEDPQNPVPTGELERIRGDVEKAIAGCAGFLKTLLDQTAIQTGQPYRDIMVTFDNIKFSYGDTGAYGGTAKGSFENEDASAIVKQFEGNFISADRSSFIRSETAQRFLGETLHHVGTNSAYTDGAFANALNTIRVRQGRDKPQSFSDRNMAEIQRASMYWHQKQYEACSMKY